MADQVYHQPKSTATSKERNDVRPRWVESISVPTWSPYAAGIGLGLTLLLTYYIFGWGLGASGAFDRVTAALAHGLAPAWTESNAYLGKFFTNGANPLNAWLIYEILGVAVGGLIGAMTAGRLKKDVEKGPSITARRRMWLAFIGGALLGLSTRFARGCTSGQALTGGAVLSLGAWAFMISIFIGGYAVAYLFRKEWL